MIQSQIIPLRYNYGGISRCFEICEGQLFLCFIDEITKGDYTESKSHKVMISTNPRYINWLLTRKPMSNRGVVERPSPSFKINTEIFNNNSTE